MNELITFTRWLLLCFSLSVSLLAEVQVVREDKTPGRIRQETVILSPDWASRIPPSESVNAPEFLTTLNPGQKIALAVIAEGADRASLLSGVHLDLRFSSSPRDVIELRDQKPVTIRQIKAEGADMTMIVLNAGGITQKDREKIEKSMALVTFAVFQPEWTAPPVEHEQEVQITAIIVGSSSGNKLDPIKIKIRAQSEWLGDPLPSKEELGKYLTRYHDDLSPGRILALLRASADGGYLQVPSIMGFFAAAYSTNSAARAAAVADFPRLDPKSQFALLYVLRLAGQDVSQLLPAMPADAVEQLLRVAPLKDPRNLPHFTDPVMPEAVQGIGAVMDECWAGWMATGEQSYLRSLVGLLEGAPDFPALQSWTKARGGVKGLNAQVANGLAYQIAGWSIGSFQRSDPLVADWLHYWKNDPTFPPLLRKEISALPMNPAFSRN